MVIRQSKLTTIIAILLLTGVKVSLAQNLYPEINSEQRWGYVDETKTTIIPFIYDYAAGFSDELARVKKGGKYGFINSRNKITIPCKYKNAKDFSEGFAAVNNGEGWGYINKQGVPITQFKFRKTTNFSRERAFVLTNFGYELIDTTGVRCTDTFFQEATPYISPHTTVKQHGLYSLINLKGEVVDSLYSICWPFRRAEFDSLAYCVAKREGKWTIIDENMQTVWKQIEDTTSSTLKESQVISREICLTVGDNKVNICRKRELHNTYAHGALTFCDSLPNGEQIECTMTVLPGENLFIEVNHRQSELALGWSLEGLGGRHFTSLEPKNILPLKNLTPSYYKIEFFTLEDGKESVNNRREYRFYPIDPFH